MGLRKWARGKAMSAVIGWVLKQIAEGKWGSGPQKLYAFLQGKKTAIAAILGILYGALQTAQGNGACALLTGKVTCADLSSWLGAAAAFLALIGLVDGALRMAPPKVQ